MKGYIKINHYGNPNRHCLDCVYMNICNDFDIDFPTDGNKSNDCGMYTNNMQYIEGRANI